MENSEKLRYIGAANPDATREFRSATGRSGVAPADVSGPEAAARVNAPLSPWLYIAGLCVTLSGLYAVSYGRDDSNFATTAYTIAIVGYALSYALRRARIGFDSLRLPLLVLIGLGLFAWLTMVPVDPGADGRTILADRSHGMQVLCVWLALLQPFCAMSDMLVLASCVPCMSLIALVSTTSPESEIQYAFLVFIAAATFLMVHENYLRTRGVTALGRKGGAEQRLFGGQVLLATSCVTCAFLLANVVSIPMHAFGRSLALSSGLGAPGSYTPRQSPSTAGSMTNDNQTMPIATGPVSESDTPVMRVEAPQPVKWRGSTFDYYSGRAFENRLSGTKHLSTEDEAKDLQSLQSYRPVDEHASDNSPARFMIPTSPAELAPQEMRGAKTFEQTVTVLIPGMAQCYAAGDPVSVKVPRDQSLVSTMTGSVFADSAFAVNSQYHVTSVIPAEDETILRTAAASSNGALPLTLNRYLQRAPAAGQENEQLRRIALHITDGLKTSYDKAEAIRDYISRTCNYNLQASAAPDDSDRVENFLTVSHQGYCDSFAASMTMLCRYADIPARVATGFLPGEADQKGGFLVRLKDKHAWSEVFIPGAGWVAFDATEGADDISDHSSHSAARRVDFLAWLFSHGFLPPLLLVMIVALLGFLVWTELLPRVTAFRRTPSANGEAGRNQAVVQAYLDACRYLDRRGLHRPKSATPTEFLAGVRSSLALTSPAAADAFASLTALHDRFRYSRETASESDLLQAHDCAAALRTALARVSAKALQTAPQAV